MGQLIGMNTHTMVWRKGGSRRAFRLLFLSHPSVASPISPTLKTKEFWISQKNLEKKAGHSASPLTVSELVS